ncbi:uncharacterized protein FIBRA_03950 [Fibroporia radiculosa]|uniref:Protein kinase domain-containing protein n=1 Tax=Fibroporia radiculosa TaxID=599839 RepID=J4H2P4_9APHY|nr:uncharacterized protein FIBRA_03950 [Fibroporia radiculosa]CCM01879.1 predicted protein [Fibroporia radiculosa]
MPASLSPPRTSPPLTPPQTVSDGFQTSPASSDDSSCLELSFVYEVNAQGDYVRISKGSSKSSSPPTPEQSPKLAQASPPKVSSPAQQYKPPPLSRSESLPASSLDPTPSTAPRSFTRVASGPIHTPASSSSRSSFTPLSVGGALHKSGGARRVRLEAYHETDALVRPPPVDEKENVRSSLQSHTPLNRPIIPIRQSRSANKKYGIEKIVEEQILEDQDGFTDARSHSATTGRPRRSASLSNASGTGSNQDPGQESRLSNVQFYQQQYNRPGTSSGMANKLPGRVTIEEKIRQERQIALEEGYARREAEELVEAERKAQSSRHSPSPTHVSSSHIRSSYTGHNRRNSDTLRSLADPQPGSPTVVEYSRISPPDLSCAPPSASSLSSIPSLRHRRSPTVPEPPTTSGATAPSNGIVASAGKTWAAGDGREKEQEDPYDSAAQARSLPALPLPQLPAAAPAKQTQVAPAQPSQGPAPVPDVRSRNMVVNKKAYARLDMIGKGGSSRVYRVMNGANEIFAIKRVSLDKTDAETMNGYMNEIALLKRLEGNGRIIRLIDSELKAGPGGSKGHLMLVMECGEIDLARLLQEQQKEALDLVWIAYYWKQASSMLQAVHVIHEEKIVHSDLKPANFVLVRGQLKLIDFGIANAIANDTTNIQRDHQIGTVNYMSPEAIELPDGMRRLKVGRPSDVWSLGCILYQMVYGHPPFQHLSVYQKMKAIPDGTHVIDFPEYSTPSIPPSRSSGSDGLHSPRRLDHLRVRVPDSVIATIRSCLARNPKERMAIPELLQQSWLVTGAPEPSSLLSAPPPFKEDEAMINPFFMQQLLNYGISLGQQGREMDSDELLREAEILEAFEILNMVGTWSPMRLGLSQKVIRALNTHALHHNVAVPQLNRSYLYVPTSSDRMLQKSLSTNTDIIIYDLEDSVPPSASDKDNARERLRNLFSRPAAELPRPERVAVRLNSINTPFFQNDIAQALRIPSIRTIVMPKIHSAQDLHHVSREIYAATQFYGVRNPREQPVCIVASIESAKSMINLREIAAWQSEHGPVLGVTLGALLFAAEDYCADTSIIRTKSRQELLYTRSQIAITAKAFALDAIDMVCVNYKDLDYLKVECEDGRRLGFNGKQAIHPTQVDIIQSTFVPDQKEIVRAAKILHRMKQAHSSQKGAIGLELEGGGKEMIDAPMIKQAENVIRIAQAAGLKIPDVE